MRRVATSGSWHGSWADASLRYICVWLLGMTWIGCARRPPSTFRDNWGVAAEVCGWASYDMVEEDYFEKAGRSLYPSQDCVDQVLRDIRADIPAFLSADNLTDPYFLVAGDLSVPQWRKLRSTRLGNLLVGLRSFFAFDFGSVEELHEHTLLSSSFVADMKMVSEQTGRSELKAVLYNYVTSVTTLSRPGVDQEPLRMSFSPRNRVLMVNNYKMRGIDAASVMVHEARHAWGLPHQICGSDHRACDTDLSGGYGYQLSTLVLAWNELASERVKKMMLLGIEHTAIPRLRPFLASDGTVLPEWADGQSKLVLR